MNFRCLSCWASEGHPGERCGGPGAASPGPAGMWLWSPWPGLAQGPRTLPGCSPALNRRVGLLLALQLPEGGKGRERCLGAVEKNEITRDQGDAVKVHGDLQMKQAAAAWS